LEKFSNELQSADISAEYGLYSLPHILQTLQELRNDVEFQQILSETTTVFDVALKSETGRPKKVPRSMEDEDNFCTGTFPIFNTTSDESINSMRQSYYEVIDLVTEGLSTRFQQ